MYDLNYQPWLHDPRYQYPFFPQRQQQQHPLPRPERHPPSPHPTYSYNLDSRRAQRSYYPPAASPRGPSSFSPLLPQDQWAPPLDHSSQHDHHNDHIHHHHHTPYPQPTHSFPDAHDLDLGLPILPLLPAIALLKNPSSRGANVQTQTNFASSAPHTSAPHFHLYKNTSPSQKDPTCPPAALKTGMYVPPPVPPSTSHTQPFCKFRNKRQSMRQSRNAPTTAAGAPILHPAASASSSHASHTTPAYSPFNEPHAAQYTEPWIAYNPQCPPSKTQGQAWSAAYRSDPCQIFRNSTTFQTPAPLHSPAQSHPIQHVHNNHPPQDTRAQVHLPENGPIVILPDRSGATGDPVVHPTVHDPIFPENNSLYEAKVDSGRSGTVTSVTGSGCPPDIGLGFETDHGLIGSHLSAPVYTPRLTHDNYAFQDATLTATASRQLEDSSAHVQPAANDSIAISPGIPGLDAFTSKWESTVLPVGHDPSLSPTGHRSHIPLPMRRHKYTILDNFLQPAMCPSASGEHTADNLQSISTQYHENVSKAAHYLRHVDSKQWTCICGIRYSNYYNANRHVRESVSCSACHKKIGRNGNGTYCRRCKRHSRVLSGGA